MGGGFLRFLRLLRATCLRLPMNPSHPSHPSQASQASQVVAERFPSMRWLDWSGWSGFGHTSTSSRLPGGGFFGFFADPIRHKRDRLRRLELNPSKNDATAQPFPDRVRSATVYATVSFLAQPRGWNPLKRIQGRPEPVGSRRYDSFLAAPSLGCGKKPALRFRTSRPKPVPEPEPSGPRPSPPPP